MDESLRKAIYNVYRQIQARRSNRAINIPAESRPGIFRFNNELFKGYFKYIEATPTQADQIVVFAILPIRSLDDHHAFDSNFRNKLFKDYAEEFFNITREGVEETADNLGPVVSLDESDRGDECVGDDARRVL